MGLLLRLSDFMALLSGLCLLSVVLLTLGLLLLFVVLVLLEVGGLRLLSVEPALLEVGLLILRLLVCLSRANYSRSAFTLASLSSIIVILSMSVSFFLFWSMSLMVVSGLSLHSSFFILV